MDAVLAAVRAAGWPEARLHYEFFEADTASPRGEGSFQLRLASSGRVIGVGPDPTVVQALQQAGVTVPVSCGQGICGACVTRVLDGEPERRELFLTLAEQACNDQFQPRCSRATSALLVLDL
ncbi:MAG: flavin reductase family protein [Telluria sp.]